MGKPGKKPSTPDVRFGIDQLLHHDLPHLKGKRIAFVTNDVARTSAGVPSRLALKNAGVNLVKLFSPEHGIAASAPDGAHITDTTDNLTGLPVISLYGATHKPPPDSLHDIDLLLFDIPDIGARFYTYIWTLSYVLEAAAESNKELLILDRPNPIGGDLTIAEGPILEEAFVSSFVGRWSIPIRHSLTVGELAQLWNAERKLAARLHVIKAPGWRRHMHWPQTSLPFIAPSPNMPSYESALLYPGTCLFEGSNLCEGRGTHAPFQIIGAPWLDAAPLSQMFNDGAPKDVIAKPIEFTPTSRKFQNQKCSGLHLQILNPQSLYPVSTGLTLLGLIARLHPDDFQWHPYPTSANPKGNSHFERLIGLPQILESLESRPVDLIDRIRNWTRAEGWQTRAETHLLYPQ